MKVPLWTALCLFPFGLILARDPYDSWPALPRLEEQPRVLNTDDVTELRNYHQELCTVEGDFNLDGSSDVAVSGLYDLADKAHKYFLLVASFKSKNPASLFYREFDRPVYL